jgi:hypothetical protein
MLWSLVAPDIVIELYCISSLIQYESGVNLKILICKWGHPLKVKLGEKTPPCVKNNPFFT